MAPRIVKVEWGMTTIEFKGTVFTGKDFFLSPEHIEEWDWSRTDLHHQPGVSFKDIEPFKKYFTLDYIIISRGFEKKLLCDPELLADFDCCFQVFWLETSDAVKKYNELVEKGCKVAFFLHSTC
jgi:hypothetical protein